MLLFLACVLQGIADFLLVIDRLIGRNGEKDRLRLAGGNSRLSTQPFLRRDHGLLQRRRIGRPVREAWRESSLEEAPVEAEVPVPVQNKKAEQQRLLLRLNELVSSHQLSLDRVRVLVLAQEVAGSIQSSAESMGLPENVVQPFYAWVCELSGIWKVKIPLSSKTPEVSLDAILRYVEAHRPEPVLDIALLDEDQNLPPAAYRLLALVSRHVTIFAGQGERLYDCF
jgi:hypothetical protein